MDGARSLKQEVMDKYPQADIHVAIVWTERGLTDCEFVARENTKEFEDPRVIQFYDPSEVVGKAFAEKFGYSKGVAWDIYMFYAVDSLWRELPPFPTEWMHQLGGQNFDTLHYHCGDDLKQSMAEAMKKMFLLK